MFKNKFSAIGLAMSLAFTTGAQATPLKITSFLFNPAETANITGYSGNVYAGGFNAVLNGTQSFIAFCVDTLQTFSWNTSFEVTPVDASVKYGTTKALALGQLYSQHFGAISNAKDSAAFQLALWEIVNETGTSLSLSSGAFKGNPVDGTILNTANNWLSSLSGAGNTYQLTVLYSPTNQDQIYAKSVPEPGSIALLVAGFAALGFTTRRRNLPV